MQPPERGGLGLAPSEAKSLTWDEADFYLCDEKRIRRADKVICERLQKRGAKPEEKKKVSVAEYMRQLRMYFTGKEDRDG